MNWQLKAFMQGLIAHLPQAYRWNYLFQRHITKSLRLTDKYFRYKLDVCRQHMDYIQQYDAPHQRVLELGTGWLPIIPIGLYLCGVDDIVSIDVNPMIKDELVRETIRKFLKFDTDLINYIPYLPDRLARLNQAVEADNLLEQLDIKFVVADARTFVAQPFDVITSNNVLEHIPKHVLDDIFANFGTLLKPNGLMIHWIDLTDHYSHSDSSINHYNFLQFTPYQWKKYNNSLHYQNRLRASDYRRLHESAFDILFEKNSTSANAVNVPLAPKFQDYDPDDLLITSSWMISRRQTNSVQN